MLLYVINSVAGLQMLVVIRDTTVPPFATEPHLAVY